MSSANESEKRYPASMQFDCSNIYHDSTYTNTKSEEYLRETNNAYKDLSNDLVNSEIINEQSPVTVFIPGVQKTKHIAENYIEPIMSKMEECRKSNLRTHFAEKQNETASGIMLDLDIDHNSQTLIITDDDYVNMITNVCEVLMDILEAPDNIVFHVAILHSDIPRKKNGVYRESVHIIIPSIMVSKPLKMYFVQRLINEKTLYNSLGEKKSLLKNENILDNGSSHVPIFFLGSCKNDPAKSADQFVALYKFTKSGKYARIRDDTFPEGANLCWELSVNINHSTVTYSQYIKKSVYGYKNSLTSEIISISSSNVQNVIESEFYKDSVNTMITSTEFNLLNQLVQILADYRADEYKWWNMSMQIIASYGENFKSIAQLFSSRSSKYNSNDFEAYWSRYLDNKTFGNGMEMIKSWAKKDNPEQYRQIVAKSAYDALIDIVYSTHNRGSIPHAKWATVIKLMLGFKFIYDGKNNKWYEFILPEDNAETNSVYKYRVQTETSAMSLFISDVCVKLLEKIYSNISTKIQKKNKKDRSDKDQYYTDIMDNLSKSIRELNHNQFKTSIINECKNVFTDYRRIENVDKYENILPVGNGVLVLGQLPELITYHHNYVVTKYSQTLFKEYDPTNEDVQKVEKILRELFPESEQETYEFIMCWMASGLDLRNKSPHLLYVHGEGSAGKSMITDMFRNAVGNKFCTELPASILTNTFGKSGDANSALSKVDNMRTVIIDEVEHSGIIQDMNLKKLMGGILSTRDLYQSEKDFTSKARFILITNHYLKLSNYEFATLRRIIYVRFKMCFRGIDDAIGKYDASNPLHRVRNNEIKDNYIHSTECKEAMLSVLVKWYQIFMCKFGGDITRVPRTIINSETTEFIKKSDSITDFIDRTLVKKEGAILKLHDVTNRYINWYTTTINSHIKLSIDEVRTKMLNSKLSTLHGENSNNGFVIPGYSLLSLTGELEEGEQFAFTQTTTERRVINNFKSADHKLTMTEYNKKYLNGEL
uniref:Uncharacterized protein n=1 Tax=viral metagenome TaxID=1070528 RepID=A0A6C0BDM2_9ZZZZ